MTNIEITYISHACIKIKGEFGCLITDPWILNEPIYALTTWKFPAAIVHPKEVVKNVNYLYISHAHEDHLHVPSLCYFSRNVTIILPEFISYYGLRAEMIERTIRS